MSLTLPTPAQVLAKQVAHNESVTHPQINKMWRLFTQWVNQDLNCSPHSNFGLTRSEYMDALANNMVVLDVNKFDTTSVELFIEEVNSIKVSINLRKQMGLPMSRDTYYTQWTAQKFSKNTGSPEYETIPMVRITYNQNPALDPSILNEKHRVLRAFDQTICVWRANYEQAIQHDVDKLLSELKAEMNTLKPISTNPPIIKYKIFTYYCHKNSVDTFIDKVNNFKDISDTQVWVATYTDTCQSSVTVVPYQ